VIEELTYHNRFKQTAAKNIRNEPVSRACLDTVVANVSVRMLSISTIQHFCLELLILLPILAMRAPKPRFVAVAVAADVDAVLDKAPPRMVGSSVVWNVATFETELFGPLVASWYWRNGPGNAQALALRLSASTRPSEVTQITRQKKVAHLFVPRIIDHGRSLILSGRKCYRTISLGCTQQYRITVV
jgi:hypothetical protein